MKCQDLFSIDCFKCNGIGCKHCELMKKQKYPFDFVTNEFINYVVQKKENSVLVVGAGIAGIAISIVLIQLGFNVTLIEKDDCFEARKQGYGLTLQQGNSAVRELGIKIPLSTVSTSHYAFNEKGEILGYFGSVFSKFYEDYLNGKEFEESKRTGKFDKKGRFNVHVPRQTLRKLLYERLKNLAGACAYSKLTVLWNSNFIRYKQSNGKILCELENSETTRSRLTKTFDFIVAADGIYSTVRRLYQPEQILNFLNCVVILGISSMCCEFLDQRVFETMNGKSRIYVMPFDYSGAVKRTMWQLSFKVDTIEEARKLSRSSESLLDTARKVCKNFHSPILELINSTDVGLVSGHPVFDREIPDSNIFQESNIFFVGDALHPMSPFKGQGANQALLGVTKLGKVFLENYVLLGLKACNKLYHQAVLTKVFNKVIMSRAAVDELHSSDSLQALTIEVKGEKVCLTRYLTGKGIYAPNKYDLNKVIVATLGPKSRPHMLHIRKVAKGRVV